jgi:succinate dehydrogenase hydrophobic anchor subunit
MPKSLGQIEEHAFFILFLGILIIIFWHAVWELLEVIVGEINKRHGIPKWKLYVASIVMVILFIGVYPRLLERI